MDGHVLAADAASSFDRDMLAPDGAPASAPSGQAIRDVLLHLDGGAQDEANVAHAEMVAMAFGAHVRGVFTHETPTDLLAAGPGGEGLAAEYWVIDGETAEAAEKAASSRLALIEPSTDLLRADGMPHELSNVVAALARSVDLVVVGRPYGRGSHHADLLETVLFTAGSPAFVVPPEATKAKDIDVVVIGWSDTAECTHAIAASLPFLKRAKRVYLVSVSERSSEEEERREPAADMARHLARHGVHVEIRHLPQWYHPSAGLLNEAAIVGANLLVVGAYGRSRLREFILGGVTRELLTKSTIPMLMAH
jgi:nucleotide-binding universal stress UspA family protein